MNEKRVRVNVPLDLDCYDLALEIWMSLDMELDFYEFLALELQIRLADISGAMEADQGF